MNKNTTLILFVIVLGILFGAMPVLGGSSSGEWTETSSMNEERAYGPGAVLLDNGNILVAGGRGESRLKSAEVYNPKNNSWSNVKSMHEARDTFLLTKLNDGRVLATGGHAGNNALSSSEVYDPANNKWTKVASMNEKRWSLSGVTMSDGRVLVSGGGSRGTRSTAKKSVEIYDPKTDKWTYVSPMLEERSSHASALLNDGRILVTGGGNKDHAYLDSAEIYDPNLDKWTRVTPMLDPKRTHEMVRLADGRVLTVGGTNSSGYLNTTSLYSVNDDSWIHGVNINTIRRGPGVTIMADGRVFVVGGRASSSDYHSSAEIGFFNRAPVTNLEQPKNGTNFRAIDKETVLQWNAADADGDKIEKFRLRIGSRSRDSDILSIEKNWTTSFNLDLTDLPTGKTFYWTVQAMDEHGEWSDWASERSFMIDKEYFEFDVPSVNSFPDVTLAEESKTFWSSFDESFNFTDTRRNNAGWRVQVKASQLQKENTSNDRLPLGSMYLKPIKTIKRISGSGGSPKSTYSSPITIDTSETVTILRADRGDGYGEFEVTFPESGLGILIDPTVAKIGKYESTITWEFINAP